MINKQREWARAIQKFKKKGFTLIELIVVMAIIGILVLLAAPRFLGQTDEAIQTKHVANARNVEDASERYFIAEQDWPRLTDVAYTQAEVEAYADKIVDITGEEVELDPDGNYYDVDYDKLSQYVAVNDADKNNYILQNPVGKVYYLEGLSEIGESRVDYASVSADVPVDNNAIPDYYVQATDSDFTYTAYTLAPNGKGYNTYVGSSDYVILPDTINGIPLTDAYRMFRNTTVIGVANNVDTLTKMHQMFLESQATTLDLSKFDTSHVTNMKNMFAYSQATTLDLSSFDTSNVTNMRSMFGASQATTLNLSSFDTSNVTDMRYMFYESKSTTLDLSSFNTSNVITMDSMFFSSKSTTNYARTATDANKLNASSEKPSALNFVVK